MSPRPRFERLDPVRQRAILDVAAETFAAHGYEGASLNAILDRCGISKGAFYYHFDDKADLFATTLRDAWSRLEPEEPLDLDRLAAGEFWERVFAFFLDRVRVAMSMPSLAGLGRVIYDPPADPRVRAAIEEEFEHVFGLVRRVLYRGRELGLVRTDLPLELLVRAVSAATEAGDRWFVETWDDGSEERVEALSLAFLDALRGMVAPPDAEGSGA